MSGIKLNGYGLSEAQVAAIQDVVNAVAPGAAGVSTVGGQGGNVTLRTVGGLSLTDGGGDIPVGVGGSVDPTGIAWSTSVNLSNKNGNRVTLAQIIGSPTTLTEAGGGVEDGWWEAVIIGNGSTFAYPATWSLNGAAPLMSAGKRSLLTVQKLHGNDALITVTPLADADITPPSWLTPHIEEASPTVIQLPVNELIGATIPATGDVTLTSAGGRAVTSVVASGSQLNITVNSAFAWNDAPNIAVAANKLSDVAGNLAGALSSSPVTNNRTMPAPGTPTALAHGTATSSSMPLSCTAPAVDATHGTPTNYQWQYRTTAGPGAWQDGGITGSPTTTITGLTLSTSYDFQVQATNATGAGPFEAAITASTAGSGKITFTETFTGADGSAPNAARWTLRDAGWTVQGNKLSYGGSSYGIISAACTPSVDNALSADADLSGASFDYTLLACRYVDGNNYVGVQNIGTTGHWQIQVYVGGSLIASVDDTHNRGVLPTMNVKCEMISGTCKVTFTGSADDGNFSLAGITDHVTASKVCLGMNGPGKDADTFDNVVLA